MKKIFILTFVAVMMLTLFVACGEEDRYSQHWNTQCLDCDGIIRMFGEEVIEPCSCYADDNDNHGKNDNNDNDTPQISHMTSLFLPPHEEATYINIEIIAEILYFIDSLDLELTTIPNDMVGAATVYTIYFDDGTTRSFSDFGGAFHIDSQRYHMPSETRIQLHALLGQLSN